MSEIYSKPPLLIDSQIALLEYVDYLLIQAGKENIKLGAQYNKK